jgi:hypothetical protein
MKEALKLALAVLKKDMRFYRSEKLAAIAAIEKALAQPEQDNTYVYASSLATVIWQKHYMKDAPKWKPLNTTEGVLIQIDNMTCGLVKEKKAQPEQAPVATAFDVTIEDEALKILDDMVSPSVDDECNPIRLLVGEGHSGYGVYIASADYPDEGANFLVPTPKLYTSPSPPPQRTWVDLTEEQIEACWNKDLWKAQQPHNIFARAVLAKFKGLNT